MKGKQLEIVWSPEAIRQLKKIRKWKSKESIELYFERIKDLIEDIQKSPFEGIGKPEPLKYKIPPCWSRRINLEDRLIYRVVKNELQIISILGHYNT